MTLIRWRPYREMLSLRDAMDLLFEESFVRPSLAWRERSDGALWVPVDIRATEDSVIVTTDLPGVKPDDVEISISDNTLTLKGEFPSDEAGDAVCQERCYGSFYRSVALPAAVDADAARAEFEYGVLKVTLPKRKEAKPRQIKIKAK